MKVSKTKAIRTLLTEQAHLSAKEVADLVNCHITLVYDVRKQYAKSIVAKRMGKQQTGRQISIKEASDVLQYLVKDVKDLCIAFDHSRDKLDVIWREEVFQVEIDELPKTIDSIKFLSSRDIEQSMGEQHDNA